jgi:hypothetical protein
MCEEKGVVVVEIPHWYKVNRELIKELVWDKVPHVPFKMDRTKPYYAVNYNNDTVTENKPET